MHGHPFNIPGLGIGSNIQVESINACSAFHLTLPGTIDLAIARDKAGYKQQYEATSNHAVKLGNAAKTNKL